MGQSRVQGTTKKWLAGIAAGSLLAGSFVAVGIGAQMAQAAVAAPKVTVEQQNPPLIAGEDVTVDIGVANDDESTSDGYNLGLGVLVPQGVIFVGAGESLGQPKRVYQAGETVPSQGASCEAVGLTGAGAGASCTVPEGSQYLVFPNISDLPAGASNRGSLTLRPDAGAFPVGSNLDIRVFAFASDDERFLPSFPGSGGSGGPAATSQPGIGEAGLRVGAARIEKSEPSPENELLRGVHDNTTTYTLRVWHTGEGDIDDLVVTDFLPAGLEYLGLGGTDNTTNANGTQGGPGEYPGKGAMNAPAPHDSFYADADRPADHELARNAALAGAERVETLVPTADDIAAFPGLDSGRVYTKVTWNIGRLAAAGLVDYSIVDPHAQSYPDAAGRPGFFEIRYRAAVPLFENTLDFGGETPSPEGGLQGSNLDNNRGASTRQGQAMPDPEGAPRAQTNVAGVSGVYTGEVASSEDARVRDTTEHTVTAMDVRVLKTVDNAEFTQGGLARYRLDIATSEYTGAELGGPGDSSADVRPNRLTDDLGDGICPAIPAGAVTPGDGYPRLLIGDPRPGGTVVSDEMSPEAWSRALLDAGVGADCAYPSERADTTLEGATLSGIAFDPATGHFFLDLYIEPLGAGTGNGHDGGSTGHEVVYTAAQNALYAQHENEHANAPGATTSGDTVRNTVDITATTAAIDELSGVTSAGDPGNGIAPADADGEYRAEDDSHATLEAPLSGLSKQVLPRSAEIPGGDITAVPADAWEPEEATEPFAVGDDVWWRITVTPPAGADVRAPKLTDFLPQGTEFDPALDGEGRFTDIAYRVSSETALGTCSPSGDDWLDEFVPNPAFNEDARSLTWDLGSADCGVVDTAGHRFFPKNTQIDIFIKVRVVDVAAFDEVDLSQNLAKYQQRNVDGEIFFLRDDAAIHLDTGARLTKGLETLDGEPAAGNAVNSNVDGGEAVQGDEVRFRIDVTAPSTTTQGYRVYDALPEGIRAADLKGYVQASGEFDSSAQLWQGTAVGSAAAHTAVVYDWDDLPQEIKVDPFYEGRSIVVWEISESIPGSTEASETEAAMQRGFTLGYTVVTPDGVAGGDAAQLAQRYENTASISSFAVENNGGGVSRIVPTLGDESGAAHGGAGDGGSSRPVSGHTPGDGEFGISADLATDPSHFSLPDPRPTKALISTQIAPPATPGTAPVSDPRNPANAIVQGEIATFEYTITLPAKTTVKNFRLSDGGLFGYGANWGRSLAYEFVDGSAQFFGPDDTDAAPGTCDEGSLAGFTCAQSDGDEHGVLSSDEYTTGDADETFRVRVSAWVTDRDASNPSRTPDLANPTQLRNTATFGYDDPNTPGARIEHDASAEVRYIEPRPTIVKTQNARGEVAIGDEVDYTLTVGATANLPKSYDNVVVDEVPEGLEVDPDSFTVAGSAAEYVVAEAPHTGPFSPNTVVVEQSVLDGEGGTITWSAEAFTQLDELPAPVAPGTVALGYTAVISPSAGAGREYPNTARVTGQTLPADLDDDATNRRGDRVAADETTVRATTADIAKGVRVAGDADYDPDAVAAPIGETVQYEVRVDLFPNINYYDIEVRDALPAGVELDADSVRVHQITGTGDPVDVTGDWNRAAGGQTSTWSYGQNGGDIASNAEPRTLIFSYDVLLAHDGVAANIGELSNTAGLTWRPAPGADPVAPLTDDARVDVLDPVLAIEKKVDFAAETAIDEDAISLNPDGGFSYEITVRNSGVEAQNLTAAHNVTVTDRVPEGVRVDVGSIAPAPAAVDGDIANGSGGTITWKIAGPLHPAAQAGDDRPNAAILGYDASFVDTEALTTEALVNYANVTHFESFADGGREYDPSLDGDDRIRDDASVAPVFPFVELEKTVGDANPDGLATVGSPFQWQLTLTNTGAGSAQTVDVTDVLPRNWVYDEHSAQVKIGAAATRQIEPKTDADAGRQTLLWSLGEDTDGFELLPGTNATGDDAARTVTITFTATPQKGAIDDAGTGAEANPHTNQLRAVTTDTTGSTENADDAFTGDDDQADAHIAEADLKLVKSAIGGTSNGLYGLDDGSWVAGAAVGADYAQPQWEIVVTNHGPDASEGWFAFEDAQKLPSGVTVSGWTASYHHGDTVVPLTDLEVTGGSGASGAFEFRVGENITLSADGGDYIRIVGDVNIPATVADGSSFENTASVLGETFERPGKTEPGSENPNSDDAEKTSSAAADLQIVKTVNTEAKDLGAGKPISWGIEVTNLGPSDSLSGADEAITVTDEVPEGIFGVADPSVAGTWTARLNGEAWPAGELASAGDTITWVYQGAAIAVGASPATITLTGTLDPDWAAGAELLNTAGVTPGDTPDPEDENNTSTPPAVTPSADTAIDVAKTRAVYDEASGEWVAATEAPVPGEYVSYLVEVSNLGPATARGVTVTDELPEYLTFVSYESVVGEWSRETSDAAGEQLFALTDPSPLPSPVGLPTDDTSNRASFVVTTLLDADFVLDENSAVVNRVVADADNSDPDDDTSTSTDVERRAALEIEKTHLGDAVAGSQLDYELSVVNRGPSASRGPITVADALPTHLSYAADSSQISFDGGATWAPIAATTAAPGDEPGTLSWEIGTAEETFTVPVGDGFVIRLTVDIASDAPNGAYLNTATVGGPDGPDDSTTDEVDLEREANMTFAKKVYDAETGAWVDSAEAVAGEQATFRLFIENEGPSANPAFVADTLPEHLTLASVTPEAGSAWVCPSDGNQAGASAVNCSASLLPVGESFIDIVVDIAPEALADGGNVSATLTNDALLTWIDRRTTDPDEPHELPDSADVVVRAKADLGIAKTALDPADGEATDVAVAGTSLWYQLVVRNDGPSDAVGPLVVHDTLPEGMTFAGLVGASGWQAAVDAENPQRVTFTRDAGLASGDSAPEIRFAVDIDAGVGHGTPLTNTADIDEETLETNGDPTTDPAEAPDSDIAEVRVDRQVEVSIEKSHVAAKPNDEFEVGDRATFTLDVANDGPSVVTGVTVTDTLPTGLDFVELAGDGWTLVSAEPGDHGRVVVVAEYTGMLPAAPADGSRAPQLTITALVTAGIGDAVEVVNDACVATTETNTNTEPCDDDVITTVPLADLAIEKSVTTAPEAITAGEELSWRLDVRNLGPSDSLSTEESPITITDVLPAGVHGVTDPSTEEWAATATRGGEPIEFPARAGDTITWTFQGDRIAANSDEAADPAFSIALTGVIDAAWVDDEILNSVEIVPGATRDRDPSNNDSEVPVAPGDYTSLRIDKARVVQVDGEWVLATEQQPVPPFVPGDDISYRITVVNDGPADAREVAVVDEVPEGLSYVGHESIGERLWQHAVGGTTSNGGSDGWDTFTLDGSQEVGPEAALQFVVTYATDAAMQHDESDPLINWAEATAENWVGGFDRDDDDATSNRSADLSIEKSHTAPAVGEAVVAGETVEYRLRVANHGPSVSDQPIVVSDTLPTGFSYVEGTARVSVDDAEAIAVEPALDGQRLVWGDITGGLDLAVGGTVEIDFTALVDANHEPAEDVLNLAVVDGPNDNDITNDRDDDPVDVTGVADLTIGKTATTPAEAITAGEPVTWRLTPRNAGPSTSWSSADSPITVMDTLPPGIAGLIEDPSNDFWAATTSNPGGWSHATAGDMITFTYRGDRFLVGAEPDIEITALIDPAWEGGAITNVAVVSPGETTDPEGPNEDTSTVTPGDRTVLDIAKNRVVLVDGEWVLANSIAPAAPPITPGADVSYRIDVINKGPAIARDVRVVDPIPAGLSDPRVANIGSGEWAAETTACEAGIAEAAGYSAGDCLMAVLEEDLGVGKSEAASFIVTFTTAPDLDPDAELVNWAQARADNVPEDERPDDSDNSHQQASADLSIVKTADVAQVQAGDTVGYRLVVTNEGPSSAHGPITVTDALPLGMSYVPGSAQVQVADGESAGIEPELGSAGGAQRLTWTPVAEGQSLEPGETIVLMLDAVTAADRFAPDGLRNVATVTTDDDSNPLNDESDATVVVDPLVTLAVTKTAVGEFKVGEIGTYRIEVENRGPTADPGPITVTDELPDGLTFHASPDEHVSVDGSTVTWVLPGGLQVDEKIELTLEVAVGRAAYPAVTNTAVLDSDSALTDDSRISDEATVSVVQADPRDPLAITGGDILAFAALVALLLLLGGTGALSAERRRARAAAGESGAGAAG
ncbi:isopeptide-forming domain-containing fimbrial protein [Leucobacter tenebrionis]|uniref:isopeptide-forming domain-containing fimbrial protein n=1 Tax=Leucobacter tenebrionis TaxID=2873270 RepID=UPI001CA754E8|nr:isopeptide-forming domain-containing fimbrial protein [Leucobacter tenebrionis]QZY51005.1 DUF11 domain-containing protein [Leucobacter tenebrionis]